MNKYYKELPPEYKLDKTIDAKNIVIGLILNLFAIILTIISFIIIFNLKYKNINLGEDKNKIIFQILTMGIIIILGYIIYIILHELTHGIFYKYFTKQKLTYGFTLTVAYCGVPNIYVRKKETIIACLAPLVIYSLIFIPLIIILPINIISISIAFLFSLHFGGCVGDMFLTFILLVKYDKDTYIKDTGPTQYIYKKV